MRRRRKCSDSPGSQPTAIAALVAVPAARAPEPVVHFRVFAATGIPLPTSSGPAAASSTSRTRRTNCGRRPRRALRPGSSPRCPRQVEESRCRLSPGTHGWPKGVLFCHAPGNAIYRIDPAGATVTIFAALPERTISDGALAFDSSGSFGYRLLAVTGRSGAGQAGGGSVFAIGPRRGVPAAGRLPRPRRCGRGARRTARRFGSAGSELLIPVDAGPAGRVLAFDPKGRARTIATLAGRPQPDRDDRPRRGARTARAVPGLYVTDTLSKNVYLAPAAELERYRRAVVVGSELQGALLDPPAARPWIRARCAPDDAPRQALQPRGRDLRGALISRVRSRLTRRRGCEHIGTSTRPEGARMRHRRGRIAAAAVVVAIAALLAALAGRGSTSEHVSVFKA